MDIHQLYQDIEKLSDEVESLLFAKDEAQCTALLVKRQSLLEQLASQITALNNSELFEVENRNYLVFLQSIQARDKKTVQFALTQSKELLAKCSQQAKNTKAIKAYRKLL